MTTTPHHSIGKEAAIALAKTYWWKDRSAREICQFQLFTKELCMDFGDFQEALETCLGRPVFTHELGYNYDGIVKEFLGEAEEPTMEEIITLIPEAKRLVL